MLGLAAARARARLLARERLGRRRGGRRKRHGLVFGTSQRRSGVRQAGQIEAWWLAEAERGGEIAAGCTAPGAKFGHFDTPARFDQAQRRSMIESVGADKTTARERRNHEAGHAKTKSDRHVVDELVGRSGLGRRRRHVIEQAVVLVVMDDECRSRPERRIGPQRRQYLLSVMLAGRRKIIGMFG